MTPLEKDPSKGINAKLAAAIRAERAAHQITVDELAEKSDIPKRSLIRLLKAERAINIEHAAAIAAVFNLELSELMALASARPEIAPAPKATNVISLHERKIDRMTDDEIAAAVRENPQAAAALESPYDPENEYDQ